MGPCWYKKKLFKQGFILSNRFDNFIWQHRWIDLKDSVDEVPVGKHIYDDNGRAAQIPGRDHQFSDAMVKL
jgi:hypothetical protein